ncbi:MAG: M23 family peptidase, partial [Actinomycetota bacterium]|nr:M23 family peptidase [Actinomycetota bacterium]
MLFRPSAAASIALLLLCAGCAPTQETASPEPAGTGSVAPPAAGSEPPPGPGVATPVVGRVLAAPVPVPATDGRTHLAYELVLTNTLPQDVTVTSIDVTSGDRTLLSLPGDRLAHWTRIAGNPEPTTTLGPAQTAYVWIDVAVDSDQTVPAELRHLVAVSVPDPSPPLIPAALTENIAPVTVQTRTPVTIAPPLAGPNWLDANGCCGTTSHRTALNPIDGDVWAAERFAIDYLQLGPDGRLFTGDPAELDSYPYFGTDVLAVGDGPVVAVVDDLPEQVPGTAPTGLPLQEYGGNHVVQDLGNGNYAF